MMTFNHGLSGYLCGQVAMPLLRGRTPLSERAIGWACFLGAMAPDGDILTRLLAGRAAYFSVTWYGHRGASHSVLGTLALGLLLAAALYRPLVGRGTASPWRSYAWLAGCAWAGGLLHLLGDLFTPRWPLALLWPLDWRIGAWSHIGWFSPYLLLMFLTTVALGWGGAALLPRVPSLARTAPWFAWGVYALAVERWLGYLVRSRYEDVAQWDAYQRSLVPDALIGPVSLAVHSLWHWFTG